MVKNEVYEISNFRFKTSDLILFNLQFEIPACRPQSRLSLPTGRQGRGRHVQFEIYKGIPSELQPRRA